MTQRTTVAHHSIRVTGAVAVVAEILLEAGIRVDQEKMMFMADFHDDPERVDPAGDIPTPVKMQWTKEQREEFEKAEIAAIRRLTPTLPVPSWAASAEEIFNEYRQEETLEARVIKYLDKWDGMNEATHELVCGDNTADFVPILIRYGEILTGLEEKNLDWLTVVRDFVGIDVFRAPLPDELHRKTVEDLDFTNVDTLIRSICEGNPPSYFFWLGLNKAVGNTGFLELTFPGWIDKFPKPIIDAVDSLVAGRDPLMTPSGLVIVSEQARSARKFAESLDFPHLELMLRKVEIAGADYRSRTGVKRALVGEALGPTPYPHT